MRLRLEFTTEPFDLDEPPAHAVAARRVLEDGPLEAVEVGPFGNCAQGSLDAVVETVEAVLRRSVGAGATRVSFQVNVVPETEAGGVR